MAFACFFKLMMVRVSLALIAQLPFHGKFSIAQILDRFSETTAKEESSFGYAELLAKGRNGNSIDWLLKRSVLEAERFRQQWMKPDLHEPKFTTLARLIQKFQREAPKLLDVELGRFGLTDQKISVAFLGTAAGQINGQDVFGPFAGKWHGTWTDFDVDHHWANVKTYQPARRFDVDGQLTNLYASQYAWIGDGYGFNLICGPSTDHRASTYMLGYVEHIDRGDFDNVTARRPHVGIWCGPGQIVWVTAGEVFFEEARVDSEAASEYSINGFDYKINEGEFTVSRVFKSRYHRNRNQRGKFLEKECDLRVSRLKQNP